MTLTRRLVVCLDVRDGRVVKGTRFVDLRDVGDPVELAERYEAEGADEIVFLDISASTEGRGTLLSVAQRTAERLFIPLTIGGGVRSAQDFTSVLRAGADKVGINSAAVARPDVINEASALFGAQCVVASIDARRVDGGWRVYTHGGRTATDLDAVVWARELVGRGAGEILLTSVDADGSRNGYDLELTRAVADAVDVPVIASGGAGSADDVVAAILEGHADAALVAGILHDGVTTISAIKSHMRASALPVRVAA
ncbi:MAG: imidazole glycerol phosphate synthase subunit HisF [Gemmatimonadota bacterium]|nr:imidazole glycerol phosphate synthase subunit HisF [Gemmatimonadota bacterium]